jgi:hypothetical protein
MKVCYCEDCHKKFYGNSCLQIYYSESNMLITQDRHSTYELCNDCAMKRKAEWDALRLKNLKTNFADDFKQTISKKEIIYATDKKIKKRVPHLKIGENKIISLATKTSRELPKALLKKRCKLK